MRILGLDFGSKTGYALIDGLDPPHVDHVGTWDIRPYRGDSPGMRYLNLRARIVQVIKAFPDGISLICYEQAHHRGGAATEQAAGCVATCQAVCAEFHVEHTSVHSASLKLFATGSGRAGKSDMFSALMRRSLAWPAGDGPRAVIPLDDNAVDAAWVALWALETVGVQR